MMPGMGFGLLVAVWLVGGPILIGLDAWRFRGDAWKVAGHRQWLWKLLPISLVAVAFLPLGVWWFRSMILAADASCVPYLVKVRPMLRLASVFEEDRRPTARHGPAAATVRVEAQPAPRPVKSRLLYWFFGSGSVSGVDDYLPRVVAVNHRGDERVLFTKATWEEALEASGRVKDDLLGMGLERWRGYYGVPTDFLQ